MQFQQNILNSQDNMFNLAIILTGNRYDANDLLQDTTLKALDNQDKYIDNANFKGWMLTIMRNIFINNYRKLIRNQTIIDSFENLYHLNLLYNSNMETPEEVYTLQEINNTINTLHDDWKIPFSMFLAGYKYWEIAEEMSLPIGTIKSRIFFARRHLQKYLTDILV